MTKEDEALFRYSVISSFLNGSSNEMSARSYSCEASKKLYFHNGKNIKLSEEIIRKWIRNYKRHGYDGLVSKRRSDYKVPHLIDDDVKLRIADLKVLYPRMNGKAIYNKLIEDRCIERGDVSLRAIQRFIKQENYSKISDQTIRKSYSFEFPNDSWQADTTHGPYIVVKGKKYKTYIMIIIDDYSRMVVGAKAFFEDSAINFQSLLKETIGLYGIPKQLYVDNGGPYDNKQLRIISAKLTIALKHAKPYDAAAKGKVERFNRSLKDSWMYNFNWNNIKDIDDLNDRLNEEIIKYNDSIHSSTKEKPNDIYFKYDGFRYVDSSYLTKSFYHTVTRKANKCSIVSIDNNKYEVDYNLIGKMVEYTYNPFETSVIYHQDKEFKLVDKINNSKAIREKVNTVDYSKMINKEDEELLDYVKCP